MQRYNVIDTVFLGNTDRPVSRSIINDEPLHDVYASELAWQIAERERKRIFFVITWNLNYELHGLALI